MKLLLITLSDAERDTIVGKAYVTTTDYSIAIEAAKRELIKLRRIHSNVANRLVVSEMQELASEDITDNTILIINP